MVHYLTETKLKKKICKKADYQITMSSRLLLNFGKQWFYLPVKGLKASGDTMLAKEQMPVMHP